MVGEWAKERGKDVTTTKTTKNIKSEIFTLMEIIDSHTNYSIKDASKG